MDDPSLPYYGGGADSFLLLEAVLAGGVEGKRLLELGCGRGLLSLAAAGLGAQVTSVDIQVGAIEALRAVATELGHPLELRVSDLFSAVPERFDVIAFNPPYVPSPALPGAAASPRDLALYGGPRGRDLIDRVLAEAAAHLSDRRARFFMVASALNDVHDILRLARGHGLKGRTVARAEVKGEPPLSILRFQPR